MRKVAAENILFVQITIKHTNYLSNIVIPLHKASDLSAEFIPLLLVQILIITFRNREQRIGNLRLQRIIFSATFRIEINCCYNLNIFVRIDLIITQLLLGFINQINIDFGLKTGFCIESLEGFLYVLCLVCKVQNISIDLSRAGSVQAANCLNSFHITQFLVYDHRVE